MPPCASLASLWAVLSNQPPIPLTNVASSTANQPRPGQVFAPGQLKGPRLSGRFADGKVGEFPLSDRTSMGRHPNNTLRLVDREGAFVASRPFGVWGALEAFGWRCIVVGVLKVHCGGCF